MHNNVLTVQDHSKKTTSYAMYTQLHLLVKMKTLHTGTPIIGV